MIHLPLKKSKKTVYLDHAATTPVDPAVLKVMQPYFSKKFGNASSLYRLGIESKTTLEEARSRIGNVLGASGSEVFFGSGGTESINLALQGVANAYDFKGRIIISSVEHHAVLRTAEYLMKRGMDLVVIPVDEKGRIIAEHLEKALTKDTVLVSLMYANNEVGTIQPIHEFAKIIRKKEKEFTRRIYFHTDACQAAGALSLDVRELGIDLLTINGSKIYGPKGIGALYVRRGVRIDPLMYGGNQERALRSGTENIPGAVGLAEALVLAEKRRVAESRRLTQLREYFFRKLEKIPGVVINGDRKNRLPNNIHVLFPGLAGEAIVIHMDEYNVQCSTGSACMSSELESSHVLLAMGKTQEEADGSVRFTLGHHTTKAEIDYTAKLFEMIVVRLQESLA